MEESVVRHFVLEPVVTNHESADRGSSFERLVVVIIIINPLLNIALFS